MEILTREGSSWFPSGVYFSLVNKVFVFVFSFSAFLLRKNTGSLSAPCFNHFLSDTSRGSATTSHSRMAKNEVRLLRGRAEPKKDASQPSVRTCDGTMEGNVPWMPRWEDDRVTALRGKRSSSGKGGGLHRSWGAAKDKGEP